MLYVLIFGALYILGFVYFIQQILNAHYIKTGYVTISYVQGNKQIEHKIYTNKKPTFNFIFGVPGSGKTTTLAYLVKQVEKTNKRLIRKGFAPLNIYSNINLSNVDYIKIDKDDIGVKSIKDGILLIDESSIDYNNRNNKLLSYKAIKYFKKHRHYNISVYCFSQSYNDTDITLRRLADNYYHIKKSFLYFLNHHIILRKIQKFIFIEKEKNEILEGYKYKFLSKYRINGKKYFKYFSSYERDLELIGDEI